MALEKDFENCNITTSEEKRDDVSYKAVWVLNGLNKESSRYFLINQARLGMKIVDEINDYTLQFRLQMKPESGSESLGLLVRLKSLKRDTEAAFSCKISSFQDSKPAITRYLGNVVLDEYNTYFEIDKLMLLTQSVPVANPTSQLPYRSYGAASISSQKTDYTQYISPSYRLGIEIIQTKCNSTTFKTSTDNTKVLASGSCNSQLTPLKLLSRDFENLYLEGQDNFSDLKLESKDGTLISAHQFVLAARSPAFRKLIEMAIKQNGFDGTIMITEVNAKPLIAILHWMYTGQLKNGVEKFMEELVQAAVKFDMEGLLQALDKEIIRICNKDNMLELLQMAQKNKMDTAVKQISGFIKENL